MPEVVTIEDKVLDPATLLGVQVLALTVEIRNRNRQLQSTLVFPAGIAEVITGGNDYSYRITDFDISDQTKFPGDFIETRWYAQTAAGVVPTWSKLVSITGEAMPTIPESRTPYIDLAEAEEFFQTRLDYVDWDRFDAVNQTRALVTASDHIDGERFKGTKVRLFETDSGRQFPRAFSSVETAGGFFYGVERIPLRVRQATAVQALYLLRQIERGHDWAARRDMQLKGLTGIQRGENNETWALEHATRRALCEEAFEFLHPFLAQSIDNMPVY